MARPANTMALKPCQSDRVATPAVSAVVEAINDLASDAGLSTEDLAKHSGLGLGGFIRRSEDRFPYTLDEVDRIATALGMTLFELVARAVDYKKATVITAPPARIADDREFEDALRQAERRGWAMAGGQEAVA
ncbi:hypothetical protein [Demequina sp.]|uniref:hypothetical protein n=1 Tax=Demequina sp. TaxID=2050685 RepID=UPI003D1223DC